MSNFNIYKPNQKRNKWDKLAFIADIVCIVQMFIFVNIFTQDQSILMQVAFYIMAAIIIFSLNLLPQKTAMASRVGIVILLTVKAISISGSLASSAAVNASYGESHILDIESAKTQAELTKQQAELLKNAGYEAQKAANTSLSGVCKTSHEQIMQELLSNNPQWNNTKDINYLNEQMTKHSAYRAMKEELSKDCGAMDVQKKQNALNAQIASDKYSEAAQALEEAKRIEQEAQSSSLIAGAQRIGTAFKYIPYFFNKIIDKNASSEGVEPVSLESVSLFLGIFLSIAMEGIRLIPTFVKKTNQEQQPKEKSEPNKSTQTAIETIAQYIPTPMPQKPVVAYSDSRVGHGMGFDIKQNNKKDEEMKVNSVSFDLEALKAIAEPQEAVGQPVVEYPEPQQQSLTPVPGAKDYYNQKRVERLAHDRKRYAWLKEQIQKGNIEKLSYKYLSEKLANAGYKVSNQAIKPMLQDLITDGLAQATASGKVELIKT